jgi:glutathione S-transferase
MITLYGGGPGFGLPEISPYVTKTEVQLKMAGLAHRKERARPEQSPKGQVPFIDDGGVRVADSTFIRAYLEEKHRFDLDDGLTAVERAQAWAVERMLENHFAWVMTYTRWLIAENFAKGPAHFFDDAPEGVRDSLRADVLNRVSDRLHGVGVTRHSLEEIYALADRTLLALSELLGDKPFLFGARPTGVDATAFAMLAAVLTPFFDSQLRDDAREYRNLTAYVDRMMDLFFPDFVWEKADVSRAHVEEVD